MPARQQSLLLQSPSARSVGATNAPRTRWVAGHAHSVFGLWTAGLRSKKARTSASIHLGVCRCCAKWQCRRFDLRVSGRDRGCSRLGCSRRRGRSGAWGRSGCCWGGCRAGGRCRCIRCGCTHGRWRWIPYAFRGFTGSRAFACRRHRHRCNERCEPTAYGSRGRHAVNGTTLLRVAALQRLHSPRWSRRPHAGSHLAG